LGNSQNTADFLSEIYRGAKMGIETIDRLLTKVNDNKIYDELKYQMRSYEEIADEAYNELIKRDNEPKEISPLNRLSARMSIGINTLISNKTSHVADMLIKGNTMGINGISESLKSHTDADPAVQGLAERFINLEKDNIERLKRFSQE
jgi:hypothetical protein